AMPIPLRVRGASQRGGEDIGTRSPTSGRLDRSRRPFPTGGAMRRLFPQFLRRSSARPRAGRGRIPLPRHGHQGVARMTPRRFTALLALATGLAAALPAAAQPGLHEALPDPLPAPEGRWNRTTDVQRTMAHIP